MELLAKVRNFDSDFLVLYQSPKLNNYINRYASMIRNKENKEDAIATAWADIWRLKPNDISEAIKIADASIVCYYKKLKNIWENEISLEDAGIDD